MELPLVSVLMTAYNREKYIAAAIESVLSSTWKNFELIIVDDGSTDNTVPIAKSFEEKDQRIKVYVNEKNLGDYPNRNQAAAYASGKYLKYLDSDDLIYPHGLEVFVSMMEKYPGVSLGVSSRSTQMAEPFPVRIDNSQSHRRHFFEDGYLDCGPSGVIINHEAFKSCGGFSGKRMIGDMELWFKLTAQSPVLILPPSLIYWRAHEGQEFFSGIQQGVYMQMQLPMIREAMSLPASGLTVEEKSRVIKYYSKLTARGIISLALKKRRFKDAIKLAALLKIKAGDFYNAIFFIRKQL